MAKKDKNVVGAWAFLVGVVLAIILGLISSISVTTGTWAIILALIGVIIGLLNVGGEELKEFMIAGTVLVIVSQFAGQVIVNVPYLGSVLQALVVLFAPATIVVALKSVFVMANK